MDILPQDQRLCRVRVENICERNFFSVAITNTYIHFFLHTLTRSYGIICMYIVVHAKVLYFTHTHTHTHIVKLFNVLFCSVVGVI